MAFQNLAGQGFNHVDMDIKGIARENMLILKISHLAIACSHPICTAFGLQLHPCPLIHCFHDRYIRLSANIVL